MKAAPGFVEFLLSERAVVNCNCSHESDRLFHYNPHEPPGAWFTVDSDGTFPELIKIDKDFTGVEIVQECNLPPEFYEAFDLAEKCEELSERTNDPTLKQLTDIARVILYNSFCSQDPNYIALYPIRYNNEECIKEIKRQLGDKI